MTALTTSALCVILSLAICEASVQDIYNQLPGAYLPSPVKYFTQLGDQLAAESGSSAVSDSPSVVSGSDSRAQQPRLGYPIYSGTSLNGGGYSSTGTGMYSPLKLDLGGLLLGTVVGLGAILIIPKLMHVFSYSANSYGHYGRSEGDGEGVGVGVASELAEAARRVDRALAEHNVSAGECLQRAVCFSLTPTEGATGGFLDAVSGNPLVSFLLEGSRLERAVEVGRGRGGAPGGCADAFPRCPITGDALAAAADAVRRP